MERLPDPAEIMGAIAALKLTFDTAKTGIDVIKSMTGPKSDPAVKAKLDELKNHLADAQDQMLSLRESMASIREENLALKAKLSTKERELQAHIEAEQSDDGYELDALGIWRNKDKTAFYPRCRVNQKKWVQFVLNGPGGRQKVCPSCDFTSSTV